MSRKEGGGKDQPNDETPQGEAQKNTSRDTAIGCGIVLCIVTIAVIITVMVTNGREARTSEPPLPAVTETSPQPAIDLSDVPPAWIPPEWLSGYWSSSDRSWQAAAEPGFVDVVVSGDEALVTYTIQDWSEQRGDVFTLHTVAGGHQGTVEWEQTVRGYRDDGQVWVAQALNDDGTLAVELSFRHIGADSVMLLVTMGSDQVAVRLNRDE